MGTSKKRLVVGITACRKQIDPHPYHVVGQKYVDAVIHAMGAIPVVLPPVGAHLDPTHLLGVVDGILFTGSASNIEPHHYGAGVEDAVAPHDPCRDATTLPLIREMVARSIPLFAICRGYQEVNVAFGGTLTPKLQLVEGNIDYREDASAPLEIQYGPHHAVNFVAGGLLEKLTGQPSAMVNSLHQQGVNKLGGGLCIEATAEDGLVEAFRVAEPGVFALGVQWHPEWRVTENELSMRLFAGFADACRGDRTSAT